MPIDPAKGEREFALAPGQYTYTQDTSKGTINTYVGPNVVQPSGQEKPVIYNATLRSFRESELRQSVQTNVFASRGEYIVLSNPSVKDPNNHPQSGKTSAVDLLSGERVNIQGPANFALWPGQVAQVIPGHQLRSNEYLLIKIIDAAAAVKNWSTAAVETTDNASTEENTDVAAVIAGDAAPADLTAGRLYVIKGTDVSFYMPPTGVEVVPNDAGDFVRSALTLERLEYAVLVDESGDKRFPKGPAVVFPQPSEEFVTDGKNSRAFRAIELNNIQGIHVKVTAAYEEDGVKYKEGDELWITGTETPIYYPRHEHFLIKYDGRAKHFAVAVPDGQARYVLDRLTAKVKTVKGNTMLLPDPRNEVVVRRVLTGTECRLWYPGNEEVKKYNGVLRQMAAGTPTTRKGVVSEGQASRSKKLRDDQKSGTTEMMYGDVAVAGASQIGSAKGGAPGNEFSRGSTFTEPRTITLNSKLQGVPTLDLWTNYAVLVTSASCKKRRVEIGPKTIMLDFDESLESFTVSTGKPKSTDSLLTDVYLRVRNNKVSDIITATTSDHVDVTMKLSLVCNFTGEDANKWFAVENYVKFVTDHVRSVIRGNIRSMSIAQFSENYEQIIRNVILGVKTLDADGNETSPRPGMFFEDNALRVDDVDVLDVVIGDREIAQQLQQAQHEAVSSQIQLQRARATAEKEAVLEGLRREKLRIADETRALTAELESTTLKRSRIQAALRSKHELAAEEERLFIVQRAVAIDEFVAAQDLARQKAKDDQWLAKEAAKAGLAAQALAADTNATKERLAAIQPGFSEAILALRDGNIVRDVAEATSVQRLLGGKTLVDIIGQVFANTPLGDVADGALKRIGTRSVLPATSRDRSSL